MDSDPTHRFEIDPKRFPKDRFHVGFFVVFWLFWTPATLFVTALFLRGEGPTLFLGVWLLFGWTGVVMIPISLLQRNRRQTLWFEAGRLHIRGTRLLWWRDLAIGRADLEALTLERHGEESIYTLNLFHRPGRWRRRVMLAPFVHLEGKAHVFDGLRAFLTRMGAVVDVRDAWRDPIPADVQLARNVSDGSSPNSRR